MEPPMPRLVRLLAAMLVLASVCWSAAPVLAAGDASSALFDAYAKMINSRCVAETVSTDAKGRESRSKVEFDTIERIRVSADQASFIVLPEGTWMRSGDGEWMKPPFDMSALFKRLVPSTLEEIRAGTRNIRDEGMQTVDGQNLRAVSFDVNTQVMGISVSSHNTVFIDASGRIVRSVSDAEAMGQKTHSVQKNRYDDSIRISAPD
jgi:hypothetical protein